MNIAIFTAGGEELKSEIHSISENSAREATSREADKIRRVVGIELSVFGVSVSDTKEHYHFEGHVHAHHSHSHKHAVTE